MSVSPPPGKKQKIEQLEIHHINLRAHGDATVIALRSGGEYSHLTLIDGGETNQPDSYFRNYLNNSNPLGKT